MSKWMNLGQHLKVLAKKHPSKIAVKDAERRLTYPQLNARANRLAGGLLSLGLKKGDRIAVLFENSIEFVECYLAAAKAGFVIVPINFRLAPVEIAYILNDADACALVVGEAFAENVDEVRPRLSIADGRYIATGGPREGYTDYEAVLSKGADAEPAADVLPSDPWILIYTSGTTGRPKGVLRSHESHTAFYLINAVDFGLTRKDVCLNVMPLCHINSVFFTFIFLYIGASVFIHPARSFNPEEIFQVIEQERFTFISLIPTHYTLMLGVPGEVRGGFDLSSIRTLLCSSARVRQKTKRAIMEVFKDVRLFEAYGSTEAGIVTILRPEDQFEKLGSIGYESLGTDKVRLLDENRRDVAAGQVGEIFSKGPMLFDGYHKLPEKTAQAFHEGWFSAGDMGRMDKDGFFELVDRKDNMIITGGENVFPSEVEEALSSHEAVFDCAVIGVPDDKWGERVAGVVILKRPVEEQALIDHCRGRIAGYKIPKQIFFIDATEMPRNTTGKILHRELRRRFSGGHGKSETGGADG